jgi:hypothetical protein
MQTLPKTIAQQLFISKLSPITVSNTKAFLILNWQITAVLLLLQQRDFEKLQSNFLKSLCCKF